MRTTEEKGVLGYVQGLLIRIGRANCVQLAQRTMYSHDRLSRILGATSIDWEAILWKTATRILDTINEGYLIVDETTIDKSWSKVIEGLAWIWSSRDNRHVYGYHITVLIWTNGTVSIPLALRVYQKAKEKKDQITTIDHALDLLAYAKNTLKLKPKCVLADGYYGADKLIKLLESYDWKYIMRCKRNRKLDDVQIKKIHCNPYWQKTGILSCNVGARIIRQGKRYFITNMFDEHKKDIVDQYGIRWSIEELFRVLHSELGLQQCESRSRTAQLNHFYLSLLSYGFLESERTRNKNITHYARIQEYRLDTSLLHYQAIAGFIGGA
jgi:putative transposase